MILKTAVIFMNNSVSPGKNESSKCKHANQMNLSTSFGIFLTKKTEYFPKGKVGNWQTHSDNYCSGTLKKVDLILSWSVYKVPFTMRDLILNSPESYPEV